MSQYKEISTLQYMGSKSRILPYICDPIVKNNAITRVIDLFAGTGSVGYALKETKNIVSNDIEYYAYIINKAILNGCVFTKEDEEAFDRKVREIYSEVSSKVFDCIEEENRFFNSEVDYKAYKTFCDNTPSVFTHPQEDMRFSSLEKLVKKVTPGAPSRMDVPCLFLTYYANAYFGVAQCCQIDSIRSAIASIDNENVKNILLTVLMSVMSSTASTTTHFAQFLKVNSAATCRNLIEKRKVNIITAFSSLLKEYRDAGLCAAHNTQMLHACYNQDFADCLSKVNLDNETLVYADPPYFKEHYSRYYHVLNTLCLYDYPSMSINHQTKELSVGRYREDRSVSDFGKKAKAIGAFKKLIDTCADANAWLMISYSDNSIVDINSLQLLAEQRYDVLVEKIELNHSKQGRSSTAKVDEYIFTCRPKNAVKTIEENLAVIKSIKPIVDNPAGFMHNYMARKPYNVVSELIKRFSPEGGCVYDPMFGSGTTLIEASKLGRRAIGTDINLLAYKLCFASLKKWDISKVFALIDDFVGDIRIACEEIYSFEESGEQRILERCHFDQRDDSLVPTAYWYKTLVNNKLSGRKKGTVTQKFKDEYCAYSKYVPHNISNAKLIPNSRIAIGNNDTVYMYFCHRNLKALDCIINKLDSYREMYGYEILEMLASSAINLIKLSDKKASSQMPYWLPKTDVTSRNAVFVVEQKATAFKEGLQYLAETCKSHVGDDPLNCEVIIQNIPAQSISQEILQNNSVDLVLTDPPYTDQVPYLEYSQLWYKVMNWHNHLEDEMTAELVVSDAPSRNKDIKDFNSIFAEIVERVTVALKDNGYFIMFYHSFDLTSWSHILSLMHQNGYKYCGQIPSAAPRKSFKTVMTPKGTLDGNYIVVFQKQQSCVIPHFDGTLEDARTLAISCARRIIAENEMVTSQDLYDQGMLKESFELGYLPILAEKYNSFVDVISNEFDFANGVWKEKLCTGC